MEEDTTAKPENADYHQRTKAHAVFLYTVVNDFMSGVH